MKAIVIATTAGRELWLDDCLKSLEGYKKYPVIVLEDYAYELGKIRRALEIENLEEFLFLQDSVIVKEYSWIDDTMNQPGSVSLSLKPFFMYMGKYTRTDLAKVSIPKVTNKHEAVRYEDAWTKEYDENASDPRYLWPLFDTAVFEERHGRNNMVLENEHIIKYKGTWSPSMIKDND